MKINYKNADGKTIELEVSEEVGTLTLESVAAEKSNDRLVEYTSFSIIPMISSFFIFFLLALTSPATLAILLFQFLSPDSSLSLCLPHVVRSIHLVSPCALLATYSIVFSIPSSSYLIFS